MKHTCHGLWSTDWNNPDDRHQESRHHIEGRCISDDRTASPWTWRVWTLSRNSLSRREDSQRSPCAGEIDLRTIICDAFTKRDINGIISSGFGAYFIHTACKENITNTQGFCQSRHDAQSLTRAGKEVISVFMKWDSHHSISEIKCFLDTITVMHIDINIQNSFVVSRTTIHATLNINPISRPTSVIPE